MSQRVSGYARKPRDLYETPWWVTQALINTCLLADNKPDVWEPAAGNNAIVRPLRDAGFQVYASDLAGRSEVGVLMSDFLTMTKAPKNIRAVITNPPYKMAQQFIEKALDLMGPPKGMVAMLLRIDYDSAGTRKHLFRDCPAWWLKVVLTKRIRFEVGSTGSPSFNHAWYAWSWEAAPHAPTIGYYP